MATKFLRKIILEELHKVLNEQAVPGAAPGQTYTPVAGGVTGKSKSTPKPGSVDFMGPEQPTAIPGSGSEIKSSPRRIATLKLQKKLAELGFLDKKDVIGVFGPKTTAAINAALSASGTEALNTKDIQKIPTQDINTMVAALSSGNKAELQKIAVKYRVGQATAGVDAALKRGQTSPSATPAGAEEKTGPSGTPSGLPGGVMSPEEKKKSLEESITREFRKLLRNF